MTIEELKEKEKQIRIATVEELVDERYDEIEKTIQDGCDYVDTIAQHLFCSSCPFGKECNKLTGFDSSESKCQYFVKKYVDKPVVKMPIDEFLDKHLELLRTKLKNTALQGKCADLSIYIQLCETCPLNAKCTDIHKCSKILQEHISLSEMEK